MGKHSWIVLAGLSCLLAVFVVIGDHGILKLAAINKELYIIENKNRALESDIIDLKNKIYAIENHNPTIEKRAREELGLAKKGEMVYIFPSNISAIESKDH